MHDHPVIVWQSSIEGFNYIIIMSPLDQRTSLADVQNHSVYIECSCLTETFSNIHQETVSVTFSFAARHNVIYILNQRAFFAHFVMQLFQSENQPLIPI